MTVKELTAALQNYPPDARVVVLGYEDGYDDIRLVKQLAIMLEKKPVWYKGRYDDALLEKADQAEQAVLVYGRNEEE